MMGTIRIGTRGSPLALAQARMVATALRDTHDWGPERIEIVPITTTGDIVRDRPLAEIGGKGLWTKELDACLGDGRTDISVHSMKDVETFRPETLLIAAMLPRASVCDRLIGADSLEGLAPGARVGTSSPRRAAQILARRPDLVIVPIRGNVETRLRKLDRGEADATLLASAGLERLNHPEIGVVLDDFLPAPAQGAVGIEVRTGDRRTRNLIAAIDDRATHLCVAAERRLLEGLGGTCRSPIAALARLDGDEIHLRAEIISPDGSEIVRCEERFAVDDRETPLTLASALLSRASPGLRALFAG
ncbi:hydroxymethylbilane synthase [Sphingosinicella sp. BN140058]|uniref:hydroxymethylbilane synthase n=1 Tax=Sphingosinicella sp. BN140058 TaxID=1892855 RepID=UPI001012BEDC|nr:hydroxymethylbilane synthase [Sphingosinicella sp. BN140058]QAY76915.1 hydroxymethylbilane synthase [Sphingosinicella sp. BN140058]